MSGITDDEVELLRKFVARGYAYLISKVPNFRKKIEPADLDINDCQKCILGQLYGTFLRGLDVLDESESWAVTHGLDTPMTMTSGADRHNAAAKVLTEEWRYLLTH